MTEATTLPPHQERALLALLAAPSLAAAASHSGVSERTLRRWLGQEKFRTAFRAAQRQVVELALAQLADTMVDAVATLRRNLAPPTTPAVQVRAAAAILSMTLRGADQLEFVQRLEAIEDCVEHQRR